MITTSPGCIGCTSSTGSTPQTSPIWFLWDGSTFLVYSLESARVANIGEHGRVSLNLDGNGVGGDLSSPSGSAGDEGDEEG